MYKGSCFWESMEVGEDDWLRLLEIRRQWFSENGNKSETENLYRES